MSGKSKKSRKTKINGTSPEVLFKSPGSLKGLTWETIQVLLEAELLRIHKTRGWDLRPVLFKIDGKGRVTSSLVPLTDDIKSTIAMMRVQPNTKAVVLYSEAWTQNHGRNPWEDGVPIETRMFCWVDVMGRRIVKSVLRGEYEVNSGTATGPILEVLASLVSSKVADEMREIKRSMLYKEIIKARANGPMAVQELTSILRKLVDNDALVHELQLDFNEMIEEGADLFDLPLDEAHEIGRRTALRVLPAITQDDLRKLLLDILPEHDPDRIIQMHLS